MRTLEQDGKFQFDPDTRRVLETALGFDARGIRTITELEHCVDTFLDIRKLFQSARSQHTSEAREDRAYKRDLDRVAKLADALRRTIAIDPIGRIVARTWNMLGTCM
jgi:hypothetical protein